MPATSQSQFRLMKAAENNPKFAKKVGIKPSVAKEYTASNVGKKSYADLPAKMKDGGVVQSLKKAGFYEPSTSKSERLKIVNDVTSKPQRLKIVEKLFAEKKLKSGGDVSLAVGRGEKLPAEKGAGLTAKGRAKYNRETGSNLKAPQPEGGKRRDSFCARMGPVAEKSEKGSRARASMKRWNCPGW
jgi:hypothetical protein